MPYTILIAGTDQKLLHYLKELLHQNNYNTQLTDDSSSILDYIQIKSPQLVILDFKNEINKKINQALRKKDPKLPIIFLTDIQEISYSPENLTFGPNDYIVKPFSNPEFLIRIKLQLRNLTQTSNILNIADLALNKAQLEVKRAGKIIKLTPQEFKLLEYLMLNQEQILTREAILSHIWQHTNGIKTRVVDVYMGYLRKKIDTDFSPKLIHSIRGFGYVIKRKEK